MPGGQVIQEYMDGVKEQQLNFEYAIKSKSQKLLNDQLWQVADFLENSPNIPSANGSYEFQSIKTTSKPTLSDFDEQGFSYGVIDFQVNMTIFNKQE